MARRISQEVLERLKPLDRYASGDIRTWWDPVQRMEYTRHAVQVARSGGLGKEAAAAARKAGYTEIQRTAVKRGERIGKLIESYQWRQLTETGIRPSKKAVTNDPQFWNAVNDLTAPRSTSPTGRKARALVRLGMREPNAPWRVGESPKRKRQ